MILYNIRIIIFCIFLVNVLGSCASSANDTEVQDAKSNNSNVIVIFNDAPNQLFCNKFYGKGSREDYYFRYLGKDTLMLNYEPRMLGYDTLEIPIFEGYAEAIHKYMAFEDLYYKFIAGDTVLITYDSINRPIATSKTNEFYTYLYNLQNHLPESSINNYSLDALFSIDHHKVAMRPVKKLTPFIIDFHKKYKINLDSIYSECFFNYFYSQKHIYDSLNNNSLIDSIYNSFYNSTLEYRNDRVQKYIILNNFTNGFEFYPKNINLIYHNNKFIDVVRQVIKTRNPELIYETIGANDTLNYTDKKCMQYFALNLLKDELVMLIPPNELRYNELAPLYNERYNSEILVGKNKVIYSTTDNDLIIKDVNGENFTLQSLLDSLKGSVLYVDFWASWCAPCVAQFKYKDKLKDELKGKDVKFIYLALGDRYNDWLKAIEKYKLKDDLCFFVENRDYNFLKSINHKYIPHYLIYNKDGVLIDANAPRPSSESLIDLLQQL